MRQKPTFTLLRPLCGIGDWWPETVRKRRGGAAPPLNRPIFSVKWVVAAAENF
jgi:hypothetical protein